MNVRFDRASFEAASDVSSLSRSLATNLESRLQQASDPENEVDSIVRELKEFGHEIYSWDHNPDCFQAWGDSYIDLPSANRFLVEFNYESETERSVSVSFGPWPKAKNSPLCPSCGKSMVSGDVLLRIQGQGSVSPESLAYCLDLGSSWSRSGVVSNRSVQVQARVWECTSCGGIWKP